MMQRSVLSLAMLVSVAGFILNYYALQPPEPKPASVSQNEFSAERAFDLLARLLGDESPHPVGSAENVRVKQEILAWLEEQQIAATVQETWGCSHWGSRCAWVENIIAILPGQRAGPYLALMAHYDSVPPAAGAGDDGAGLAAVLEAARLLKASGSTQYPVMLIITDAEEAGLLGAEAFFKQHELRQQVAAVINVEGSGSSGLSQIIRSYGDNSDLLEAYSSSTDSPSGMSLIDEIFKRMPNDTDFSVSMRAKVPGLDFAFAGERNHYHTPLDSLVNLDLSTLQHHGDNLWPLIRNLANNDIENWTPGTRVYGALYGWWMEWPISWNLPLLLLAGVLMVLALVRVSFSRMHLLGTVLILPFVLALILSFTYGYFWLLGLARGTVVAWPAHDFPLRVGLFGSALLATLYLGQFLRQRTGEKVLFHSVWWCWWLLACAAYLWLPAASNLFLGPLVVAAIIMLLQPFLKSEVALLGRLMSLFVALPASLGLVLLLEESQGYRLIWASFPALGLYALLLLPFCHGLGLSSLKYGLSLVVVMSFLVNLAVPLYSKERPQHVNYRFLVDGDSQQAWITVDSPNPVAGHLKQIGEPRESVVLPWTDTAYPVSAEVEMQVPALPELNIVDRHDTDHGENLVLRLSTARNANALGLVFAKDEGPVSFTIAGQPGRVPLARWGLFKGSRVLMLMGTQHRDVDISLVRNHQGPLAVHLFDMKYGLPSEFAHLDSLRGALAVPVHSGEATWVFRKIEL
ncbi:MAG: M20/M25/M40 family metallo-hydrolase [Gammaproteobacteria bacterium]|nr:M20/M25/M40 family metallo-hydrolase [Gammaproteobacteria bacterium]MBT6246574.1 M20/M25/M40 family metallo-hydrolase [Gammaproteobacteria bacterium]